MLDRGEYKPLSPPAATKTCSHTDTDGLLQIIRTRTKKITKHTSNNDQGLCLCLSTSASKTTEGKFFQVMETQCFTVTGTS